MKHPAEAPSAGTLALRPSAQSAIPGGNRNAAAEDLHQLCGVYTKPILVKSLLDRVGWTRTADLANARLLEPGAGDGAFLAEAVTRLVASLLRRGVRLDIGSLRDRILAYELVPAEADKARARVVVAMRSLGVHHATATACARAWIRNEDFLLAELPGEGFTHIVGNPPYIRWAKLPSAYTTAYARRLPKDVARGDLYLPFLHRSFEHLAEDGRCAFVCSDRWRYTAYAEGFRKRWCPKLHITTKTAGHPTDVFDRDVYVHPEILVAFLRREPEPKPTKRHAGGQTLAELGCTIRVGPALGVTAAFVLESGEDDVEADLLCRWIDTRDVFAGSIEWSGRRVVSLYDRKGDLLDLENHPQLALRLRRFEERLRDRYIVRNGAAWYRTIDKIDRDRWAAPKLLVPEIAKIPRVAIDRSGAIPSHGVYAIFAEDGDVERIYGRLRDGKLARALAPIAPKVKGGYTRCYRRFLAAMRV